jgi:hypothetical protein
MKNFKETYTEGQVVRIKKNGTIRAMLVTKLIFKKSMYVKGLGDDNSFFTVKENQIIDSKKTKKEENELNRLNNLWFNRLDKQTINKEF